MNVRIKVYGDNKNCSASSMKRLHKLSESKLFECVWNVQLLHDVKGILELKLCAAFTYEWIMIVFYSERKK